MTRKIFFLTATRAEYDLLYPVINAANKTKSLYGSVIAAGAHLSPFHGMNVLEIRKDGVPIEGCIESLLCSETRAGRAFSFANLFQGLVRLLSEHRPHIL